MKPIRTSRYQPLMPHSHIEHSEGFVGFFIYSTTPHLNVIDSDEVESFGTFKPLICLSAHRHFENSVGKPKPKSLCYSLSEQSLFTLRHGLILECLFHHH
ncbi:unnamed protein product [Ceratitis capitata]|uniref:(Mediterranean fruit fly) hypothetical protein n=1 Tax=Ceratitis capitata TaxID=7213 RepID=A0A811UWR2_CERCA|nr:unnamed protein product [Ceratitis capitata]